MRYRSILALVALLTLAPWARADEPTMNRLAETYVKLALAGPLRLRLDYRVFRLNGNPLFKKVQRFYGGLSLSF